MMADINVVPYVDVMLVLVVILMVAAPFVNPSVVDLPRVAKAGQQKDIPVRVVVRSDGRVSILEQGKGEITGGGGTVDRIGEVAAEERRHTGGHRG